jgi:hypothetical protein
MISSLFFFRHFPKWSRECFAFQLLTFSVGSSRISISLQANLKKKLTKIKRNVQGLVGTALPFLETSNKKSVRRACFWRLLLRDFSEHNSKTKLFFWKQSLAGISEVQKSRYRKFGGQLFVTARPIEVELRSDARQFEQCSNEVLRSFSYQFHLWRFWVTLINWIVYWSRNWCHHCWSFKLPLRKKHLQSETFKTKVWSLTIVSCKRQRIAKWIDIFRLSLRTNLNWESFCVASEQAGNLSHLMTWNLDWRQATRKNWMDGVTYLLLLPLFCELKACNIIHWFTDNLRAARRLKLME